LLADKNPRSVAPSIAEFCASKTGCSSLVPVSVTLKIGLVSREVTAATRVVFQGLRLLGHLFRALSALAAGSESERESGRTKA
jgi:hypothetical protein